MATESHTRVGLKISLGDSSATALARQRNKRTRLPLPYTPNAPATLLLHQQTDGRIWRSSQGGGLGRSIDRDLKRRGSGIVVAKEFVTSISEEF